MATQVQFRRGTTAQHSSFTGVAGEVTVDTDKGTVVVHDGSTAGGAPLATESTVGSNLANTNAYIAATKSTLEATVNSNLANTNTYIATKLDTSTASATYVTKSDAVASNNSILALVNDRLQVANASVYQTIAVERAAVANTNNRLDVLEAGGALATNTYIVANYLQFTSTASQSTAGDLKIDSSSDTTGTHVKDGSVTIFTNTGSPAFVDFYCEVSNAHRVRLQSAAHSEYSGNPNVTLPATSGTLALTASPVFTGTPTSPTAANTVNNTQIATTAYVTNKVTEGKISPALTGTPTAPTAANTVNNTQIATTAFVATAVSNLVDGAPDTLNTLNEIAAALNDDAALNTTLTNSIATKLPLAGGAMTGAITTNSTFDGRDVATDGTKLDTIETNADVTDTSNVTAAGALMDSEVTNLAQVKAFDSSDYATAAQGTTADAALPKAGGTMTGVIAGFESTGIDDNATETAITIDTDERVGINITPTNRTFEVNAKNGAQIISSFETTSSIAGRIAVSDSNTTADSSVGIGSAGDNLSLYAGAVARATLLSNGSFTVTGDVQSPNFNSTSDVRLKKNIADSIDAGAIIDEMQVRQFDWIADDKHQEFGLIAQEVNQVYPDAVSQIGATWGVNYNTIVPLLLKEIQELRKRIAALES